MNKISRILIFLLILIIGIGGLAFYWTFYRPLPDYQATLEQPKLQKKTDIHWDNHGVPHIYAQNKHDLYYSMGYAHAQDRLWQMTLSQLAAQGRFSEFFGKKLVSIDKLQRTLGFWRTAEKIKKTVPDSTMRQLQAYSDGVNAYVSQHSKSLPIQFTITGVDPIKWTPTASIAITRLMAWQLNLAWKSELTYNYLSQNLPENKFRDLLPPEAPFDSLRFDSLREEPSQAKWSEALMPVVRTNTQLQKILGSRGSHVGSNAWAVDSSKSSTDKPLLAGDPHLGLNMPGKWYEVHLNLNDRNVSGASLAGAPIVVLGQNDQLAWSFTNVMLDDTDFFEEAVNPDNQNQYAADSLDSTAVYQDFTVQKEELKIKDADDTVFTRRLTRHGPVISDVFPSQKYIGDKVISMQWSGYEVSNEITALMKMDWAQSFSEFKKGAEMFKVPTQNAMYADKDGNIAQISMGNVPKRTGNPILLRKGWDPAEDWNGFLPFDELPKTINPERGWVANANNPPGGKDYDHYLSIYWEVGARYERITQYLKKDIPFTPSVFGKMQNDSYSLYARDLTGLILPVLQQDSSRFETVISYLENWDYSYHPSETTASIMDVFMLKLSENLFEDEMGPSVYNDFVQFSALPARVLLRTLRSGNSLVDDVETKDKVESRADLIKKSMEQTTAFLTDELGPEPYEWRWEQLHKLRLKPPLLGRAAEAPNAPEALKLIVDNLLSKGPYPAMGHGMSINNGEYSWNDPFQMILGPSIRRIIDFSDLNYSRSILPTGQSGNPLSEYYGDQTKSWLDGRYKFLYQDSTLFEESTYRTMRLLPE